MQVSRIAKANVVEKRGLIAKAQGTNLRNGRKRVAGLSSDDDIILGGSETSDGSGDEGIATPNQIIVAA